MNGRPHRLSVVTPRALGEDGRPIGFFVHHQGRGHAERTAAIVNALPSSRPVTIFCARDDIFPEMRDGAEIVRIPSLFEEAVPTPPRLDAARTPPTLHCAPLGWATIREAVATITRWFDEADPALFVSDVSAEIAQLARIASVPCVKVLQHGERSDPGHMAAYESSVGLLAPYDARLEQTGRPDWMQSKTFHAGGLGVPHGEIDRSSARAALGLDPAREVVLVVSGGGGSGAPLAPLTMGARAHPDALWATIGPVAAEWHETGAGNLVHQGWVDDAEAWMAAADVVIASAGNTTVHMIASLGRPFLVVPEWRYFDEQAEKARALAAIGAAHLAETWPASPAAWRRALDGAKACDVGLQRTLSQPDAAARAGAWLDDLATDLWAMPAPQPTEELEAAE